MLDRVIYPVWESICLNASILESVPFCWKNFPQFVVTHTVKGFSVVNEADVFLELSCFFDDQTDVGDLISHSSAFLNPAWTSTSSGFMYC